MPWLELSAMDNRERLVREWLVGETTVSELSRRYGVSRKTVYKTLSRFTAEGLAGLKERSHAAHRHANAVSEAVQERIVALRGAHPTWGPKKLLAWLVAREPAETWPGRSTIATVLDRHGLTARRKARRIWRPEGDDLSLGEQPNAVWCVDFKGWWRTRDGRRVDPLSLSDHRSRYLLRLVAVERCDFETVRAVLAGAFREHGLPLTMRSDNGPPFASTGMGGISRLAVWLEQAGVLAQRIAPGKPQQNGRHERMHLTVQREEREPLSRDRREQQRRFEKFVREFNEERPHEALGMATPSQVWRPSPRTWHGELRSPEYPGDWLVRRVKRGGEVSWGGEHVYLSEALAGEPVGFEPSARDGTWIVRYGRLRLASIEASGKLRRLRRGG